MDTITKTRKLNTIFFLIPILFLGLITSSLCWAETIVMMASYPSPAQQVKMTTYHAYADGTLPSPCQVGAVAMDHNGKLRFCSGIPGGAGTWEISSVFTQTGSYIYPTETATNPNIGLGIGIAAPVEKLHVSNGSLLVTGTAGSPALTVSGAGTRMFFNPTKSAFRAGTITDDRWDAANLGLHSAGFGFHTKASGDYTFVSGQNNWASGTMSSVLGGFNSLASGENSAVVAGYTSSAYGKYSFVTGGIPGGGNTILSGDSTAVIAGAGHSIASGNYSIIAGGQGHSVAAQNVFMGGGNNSFGEGENSVVLGGAGNMTSSAFSATVGGTGNSTSGENAFIGGGMTLSAQGMNSTAIGGSNNVASGSSTAVLGGGGNQATGISAITIGGRDSVASGDLTVVLGGQNNSASGGGAVVLGGNSSSASGGGAVVLGGGQTQSAEGDLSVVVGGELQQALGRSSSLLGCKTCSISAGSSYSSILGGQDNNIINSDNAFILGGQTNNVQGSGSGSFGSGGNSITGSNSFAIGGNNTIAGNSSVAIGRGFVLNADNTFSIGAGDGGTTISTPNTMAIFSPASPGKVGINVTNPQATLDIAGTLTFDSTPLNPGEIMRFPQGLTTDGFDWYPSSSRTTKKDITSLRGEEALKTLKELQPITFQYKKQTTGDLHVGFIAEEVPDLVSVPGRKSVSPIDIVAVVTKVVQEQQTMIERQQKEIDSLKKELFLLKENISSAR